MRVVIAPDKFRGTATAHEVASAIGGALSELGHEVVPVPMADGGEGLLEVLGGANRTTTVTGPLGDPVEAGWRLTKPNRRSSAARTAVIEMAAASGLELVGGPEGNDPVAASTSGTGELILEAFDAGARRIIVGLGGSATTDGGLGALRALYPLERLTGVELVVACDVRTRFTDAAVVFGPQKGATAAQVELLRRRLDRLAQLYLERHDCDVSELVGAGAAGGLAGGLAAAGATLMSGFDLVADENELDLAIGEADLVITGEGFVDEQSFDGKVVGGVLEMAHETNTPVLVLAGQVLEGLAPEGETASVSGQPGWPAGEIRAVSLLKRVGSRAFDDTLAALRDIVIAEVGGTDSS